MDTVCERQESPLAVLLAMGATAFGWRRITADALQTAGIEYHTYSVSDPDAIVDFLR